MIILLDAAGLDGVYVKQNFKNDPIWFNNLIWVPFILLPLRILFESLSYTFLPHLDYKLSIKKGIYVLYIAAGIN